MSENAKKDKDTYTQDEIVTEIVRPDMVAAYGPMSTPEKIVVGTIAAGFTGLVGFLVWVGVKQDQKMQEEARERQAEMKRKREEREAWFDDQRNQGKIVIETVDGEYIAIPAEQFAKASVRKKGK